MSSEEEYWSNLYRIMLKIRRFEEEVSKLYRNGRIPGFVHLYIGQEAVATGVCYHLEDDDTITSTHRGHGHLIAKGGDLKLMMAELYGKKTGYCKGKGCSLHIADFSLGVLGANGIVGAGIPIAVGAGYSFHLHGTSQVSVAFFGDGATNEGAFHEALNMASAWSLPVVFICENNKYGVSTHISRVTNIDDLSIRAKAYGIPGVNVDGQDVLEVEDVTKKAIDRAREGKGPTLIVADTYRYHGHFEGEESGFPSYRDEEEMEKWKKEDPLRKMAVRLREEVGVEESKFDQWESQVRDQLDEAIEYAEQSPNPEPEEALKDLFKE